MLGYHREGAHHNSGIAIPSNDHIRRLFWAAYTFEKQVSLLFGCESNIQDFDTDARYPVISTQASVRPWDESFVAAINLAKLQGQIYSRLYSAAATQVPSGEQMRIIQDLSGAMELWYTQFKQVGSMLFVFSSRVTVWLTS